MSDRTHQNRVESKHAEYIKSFNGWMEEWKPHAFATVNLPNQRTARSPEFYLSLWTRVAESRVLGQRTLKVADSERRLVWLFRREVSDGGLIHYHALVRFPPERPWLGETASYSSDVHTRCKRLQEALCSASQRTPEPFRNLRSRLPLIEADIDVRPYDRNHARYLLKGMYQATQDAYALDSPELLRDSGLIVLPHIAPRPLRRTENTT